MCLRTALHIQHSHSVEKNMNSICIDIYKLRIEDRENDLGIDKTRWDREGGGGRDDEERHIYRNEDGKRSLFHIKYSRWRMALFN